MIVLAGAFAGSLGTATGQTPLCDDQHPGNPELISGAASCFYSEVNGGQTLIQLTAGSIIRWDRLALEDPGSTLTFEWLGSPDSTGVVLNRVDQGGRQEAVLGGSLSFPDGNVIITHPNTGLNIFGTVEAGAITIVTHNLDSEAEMQLLNGEAADFTNAAVSSRLKVMGGKVVATSGDVVLGGPAVAITARGDDSSEILAPAGSVRIFGGQNFRLLPQDVPPGTSRIERLPGSANGNVFNSQTVRAGRMVEIVAESGITNNGILQADAQGGVVMMRVDADGTLINEEGALISADIIVPFPPPGPGDVLNPDRGDSPSPLSTGLSRIPVVATRGQGESSKRVVVRESAPVTGSASAQRQRANSSRGESANRNSALASTAARGSGHLARGRSFFGVRGGTKAKKR